MRLNVILFVARSAQAADSGQSSDEAVPAGDDGCWWAAKTPLLAVAAPRARVSSLPELLRGLWAEVRQQCGKNVFELADSMVIRNAAGSIIPQSLFVADAFEDGERITATVALAGGAPRERRASHRTEGSKRQARHSALPSPRKRLRADSHAHTAHRHADSDEPSSDSAGSDDGLGETAPWRNGKAKSVLHESQDILRLPAADGSVADTNIDSDAAEAAEISHVFETSNGNLPADDAAGRSDGERVPETENEDGSDGEAESPTAAESHNADADREAQAARPNSDPERDSASSEAYSTYSVPAGLAARATGSRSRENTSEIPSVHSKGEKGTLRCCDVANVDTYPLNADVGEGTGLRQSADQSSAAAADAHAIVDGDQESSGDANSADGETKGVEVGAAATNGFEPRSVIENVTSPAADTDSDPEAEDDAESESDTPAALAADPRRGSIRGGANAEDEDEEPMASSSDDAAQDDVDGAEAEAEDDGDDDGADTEAEDEADEAIDESQDRPELEDEPETQRQAEGAEEFEYEHQTSQESPSLYSQPLFPMTQSITRRSPPPPSKLLAAIDRASSTNRQPPPNRSRSFASLSELASSFQPPSQASQASKPAKIAAEDDEDESSNDEDESSNDDDDDDDDDGSDSSDDGPSIKLAGKKPKKRKSLLMELAKDVGPNAAPRKSQPIRPRASEPAGRVTRAVARRSQVGALETSRPKNRLDPRLEPNEQPSSDSDDVENMVLSEVHVHPSNGSRPTSRRTRETIFKLGASAFAIEHRMATAIADVGLQIWSGALLICEYAFHQKDRFRGRTVLELGCGAGLLAVVLASATIGCKHVYATDLDRAGILELCERNVLRNGADGRVSVRRLDICDANNSVFKYTTKPAGHPSTSRLSNRYDWTNADIAQVCGECSLVVGADIVYTDDVSFQLVKRIWDLVRPARGRARRRVVLSLERRVQFSIEALDVGAPHQDYFFATIDALNADLSLQTDWRIGATQIPTKRIPHRMAYARSDQLQLWEFAAEQVNN